LKLAVASKISETCIEATVTLRRVTNLELIYYSEKGDWVTDSHNIVARWRKHFSQLFNVRGFSDIRQRKIHTAEPLVPETSAFEVEKDFCTESMYKIFKDKLQN
jgi:hypothetical protein